MFPNSLSHALEPFSLIHCDVCGPCRTPSSSGASYFLTIIDDCSRGVWTFIMKNKSEVAILLHQFRTLVLNQFNKPLRCVRSDNGTEFTSLRPFFREFGITFETSCVGTPQQNGRVERKHRHILNIARSIRFQGNLPITFWGECILTTEYLINRTPTPVLHYKSPYEILFGKPPSYKHLKTFGCLCYASQIPRSTDKFASRGRKCIFVGYPTGQKGGKYMT